MRNFYLPDYEEKKKRLHSFMDQNGLEFILIGRRDNFAWLTGGGDSQVISATESGCGLLVISRDKIYLIAQYMDLDRIYDDWLARFGDVEKIMLYWDDVSREEKAAEIIRAGRALSDIPVPGARVDREAIYELHYPLTPHEMENYEHLGALCDRLFRKTAGRIVPGMTEQEIGAELSGELARHGVAADVLLVGSDERIRKYRHPLPSEKRLKNTLLLHASAQKDGLHANITRMVYFGGRLPEELEERYRLLNDVQAMAVAESVPGAYFQDIFEIRRKIFQEHGCVQELKKHYPGSVTGYMIATSDPVLQNRQIAPNMALDWFVTVEGAKVEELSVSAGRSGRVLSAAGYWPTGEYSWNGNSVFLPEILIP